MLDHAGRDDLRAHVDDAGQGTAIVEAARDFVGVIDAILEGQDHGPGADHRSEPFSRSFSVVGLDAKKNQVGASGLGGIGSEQGIFNV